MENLENFRKETRAWLEANCPPEMRRPLQSEEDTCWGGRHWKFQSDAQRQWLERMAAKGWTVPEWPREYGGGGLSRDEAKILRQEDARAQLSLSARQLRHLDARTRAAEVRQRRTEARASAENRPRRNPMVPGILRTRLRLRPRIAANPRRGQGRSVPGQRLEDLDVIRR